MTVAPSGTTTDILTETLTSQEQSQSKVPNNVDINSNIQVISESCERGSVKVLDSKDVHFSSTIDSMSLLSLDSGASNATA